MILAEAYIFSYRKWNAQSTHEDYCELLLVVYMEIIYHSGRHTINTHCLLT